MKYNTISISLPRVNCNVAPLKLLFYDWADFQDIYGQFFVKN